MGMVIFSESVDSLHNVFYTAYFLIFRRKNLSVVCLPVKDNFEIYRPSSNHFFTLCQVSIVNLVVC